MTTRSQRPSYRRHYDKLYKKLGYRALIDGTVTRRKLAALQALGYSMKDIARELDCSREWARDLFNREGPVHRNTAKAVDAVYARLHMTPNEGPGANRTRMRAARLRYPAPLAWDDIDSLTDIPQGVIRK